MKNNIGNIIHTVGSLIKNHGELIFSGYCYHFSWDAKKKIATNLIERRERTFVCSYCGYVADSATNKRVQRIVKYINQGGRDDKTLTKLYAKVPLSEWAAVGIGKEAENEAYCNFTSENLVKSFGLGKGK